MDRARLALNRWPALGRAGLDLYADPPGIAVEAVGAFSPALGGSAVAAIVVTPVGCAPAMPDTTQLDAFTLRHSKSAVN